ncbi:hypothetical protein THAOC_01768 [Thalassiosira oceanica]|uniref:Trichome birefringence-like C-terminal domain-containing protein n=1 Tax=Thalassiosira oceanica TaxID=159749 RepID=K0TQQ8_THAOC|nr:hypothetical protein THAOC_01768 [Thalassiosira oceanica]|mmetsp:Transcript_26103/g.58835  ORF Transcript_26103/g.58835 Transcript_26103/m.58835 type:complete len:575 (+) Transcript_26103:179-1903(+)|eukprot:EJK76472.1 hypothetical protein THAOC_01768 [Thalassiosira oceanica]
MNVRKPVYIVAWLLLAGAACASTWRLLNLLSLETSLSSNVVEDLNDLKQRGIPLMQAKEQSINDDKQQQNKSGAVALGERINDLNPMLEVKLDTMSAQISSLQERLSQLEQASSRSRGAQHVVDSNNTVSNWNSTSSHTTTTTPGMKWYCASDLKKLRNACAGESGVECTPETRASDCHSDEGCMGIDCLSVPAKCAVQRSKNNDAHQLQRPLCNRAQVRNGSWTTSALPRAPYIPMDPWQKRCATRDGLDFSAPWKSYRWAPDDVDCDFAEWDACTFCDVLAAGGDRIGSVVDERPATEGEVAEDDGRLADDERPLLSGRTDESAGTNLEDGSSSEEEDVITISFVGDSTTFQHYSSIALLLDLSVTEGDQHQSRRGGTSVTRMACNERVRLSFLRDDTLDKLHLELETQQSDIVVFNTGVHYRKDEALMRSINTTISTLENWQGICRLRKDSRRRWCLPILRTTVPGHPHCSNYTVPFNDLPTMEHRVQNANYSAFGPNYFWWKMKGQNRLVEDAFRGSSTLDYVVLDAYDVMMRRPDGHQGGHDCVHYCLPGPPDVLSRMLLHALVRRGRV